MPFRYIPGPVQLTDANGDIAAAAVVTVYDTGTNDIADIFDDAALATPKSNPFTLGSDAIMPPVYGAGAVRIEAVDVDAVALPGFPMEAFLTSTASSEADSINITPFTGVVGPDLQSGLEQIYAAIEDTVLATGWGEDAAAPIMANIDALTNASGQYRFTAVSTGTFPAGVTAATTGIILEMFQTPPNGMQLLIPQDADRWFTRHRMASAWGVWREVLTSDIGLVAGDIWYRDATNVKRLPIGTRPQVLGINTGATAIVWEARQPTLASSTTSGTNVAFTGLTGWDEVRIEGNFTTDADVDIQVSTDGTTWRTTGYLAQIHDGTGNDTATSGVRITRTGASTYHVNVTVQQMSTAVKTGVFGMAYGGARRQDSGGYYDTTAEVHTAVRIIGTAAGTANLTAVNLKCYGVR